MTRYGSDRAREGRRQVANGRLAEDRVGRTGGNVRPDRDGPDGVELDAELTSGETGTREHGWQETTSRRERERGGETWGASDRAGTAGRHQRVNLLCDETAAKHGLFDSPSNEVT